ncbi:MAG: class I SAM-dependent methyltransferase [Bacteroidales bacterium]|nr:class I SAM-dependent methyltransferase [Bacteroidales bacterium]
MKRSFADILQGLDDGRMRKMARKLPEWAAVDAERRAAGLDPLEIPSALSLEQCSSSATARYKAALAARARHRILDLTGGLGVDSWAFSQVAEQVIYYERNGELAAAAERNFERLGARGIEVHCQTVSPDTELPGADLIYADPARRDAAGRKVFLLEDCTPDILTLLPGLLQKSPAVLLKLSPMADLTMLANRLGPELQQIHVVETDGEVKELLCLLRRGAAGKEPRMVVARLGTGCTELDFLASDERGAAPVYVTAIQAGDTLLEPCPALLKAGAFNFPCARFGLQKLAPSTHLYIGAAKTCSGYFKPWSIREILPFGAAAFKQLKRQYPQAEITARNLPLGSDALRKKMGIAPGGDTHLFACRLADGNAVILVTGRESI